MSPNHEKFMAKAIELAKLAESEGEIPVGAVVVYQGEVVGEGRNQSITLNDPSAHAEMQAIRMAAQRLNNYRLIDCQLYVTLEPCPMCAGLLVHSRISDLVYGASDGKTGASGSVFNLTCSDKLNHQINVIAGVEQEKCSEMLSAFFKKRRKEIKALKKARQSQVSSAD